MAYRNYSTACSHIVDTNGNGDFTTIAAAVTALNAGTSVPTANGTIFVRPGTYSGSFTPTVAMNIVAFPGDGQLGNVIITGTATVSSAIIVGFTGIEFQTNSANSLVVSGSAASIVNLNNCYLNFTNNTGISYSSSSASSAIVINNCTGNLGTTGIAWHSMSSTGTLNYNYCQLSNTGVSITQSTNSAGIVNVLHSLIPSPLSCSGAGVVLGAWSQCTTTNVIAITTAGTGGSGWSFGSLVSGTASAISIGSGTTFTSFDIEIGSSNTNAIAGSGTFNYGMLEFNGTSSTLQSTLTLVGQTVILNGYLSTQTTAPATGFIGQQIRQTVTQAAAVTLSNTVISNITSISLPAGIWDVSGLIGFTGTITGTAYIGSIVLTTGTNGTLGDNESNTPTSPSASADSFLSIPSYRVTVASGATQTVFLTADSAFTVGTLKAYGRISATRVG